MDVNAMDEIVGVCRGEDDDFEVAGVGSDSRYLDEGGEVGYV